jgi:hypothetical protein
MSTSQLLRGLRRGALSQLLRPEDYVVPAVAILGMGIVVGAGIALLLAPTSGKSLRDELDHTVTNLRTRFRPEKREATRAAEGKDGSDHANGARVTG